MTESRFRRRRPGVTSMGASADAHYASEARFIQMREYTRAMIRDDACAKFLVKRAVTNIIRTGFGFEPNTGDEQLNADLKARWFDWSRDKRQCDAAGVLTFADIERMTAFAEIVEGDIFHVGTEEGAIQTFEAERCATPRKSVRNIVHGIQLDDRRRRLAYFFRKESPGTQRTYERIYDFHEIAAFDEEGYSQVFHVFDPDRFTQTRGVTAFHAVFDKAGLYEDIDFALLVKQQFAAMVAWFLKRDANVQNPADLQTGARTTETQPDGSTAVLEEIEPGSFIRGAPGEDLELKAANIPSSETMQHLRHTLQILSLNLGLPLCAALMDASETNFSGWRGAMDQAKLGFQTNQERYEARFHRDVAIFKLREWRAEDSSFGRGLRAVEKKGNIHLFRHWWQKPSWPYVQPLQDAQANAIRSHTGQVALRDLHAEIGGEFRQFVKDSTQDNEYWIGESIEATQRLKQKYGDDAKDVHWTHIYHRDLFKGAQLIDTLEQPNDGSGEAPGKSNGKAAPAN